jgi:hypothetical protein
MGMLERQAGTLTFEECRLLWDMLDRACRRADPSHTTPTPEELEALPMPRLSLTEISALLTAIRAVHAIRPPEPLSDADLEAELRAAVMAAAEEIERRREVMP